MSRLMHKDLKMGFMQDLRTSNENLTKGKRAEGDFIAGVSFCFNMAEHWNWTGNNTEKEALRERVLCV